MSNATLSFGVKGPMMDLNVALAVSEANAHRIIGYLIDGTAYGQITEGDETRAATPEEAAQQFAQGILRGLLDQTARFEREQAAKAAAAAIEDIELVE